MKAQRGVFYYGTHVISTRWCYISVANERIQLWNEKVKGRFIIRNGYINWPSKSCYLSLLEFFLVEKLGL